MPAPRSTPSTVLVVGLVVGLAALAACDHGPTAPADAGAPHDLRRPPDLAPPPPDLTIPLRDAGEHPPGPTVTRGLGAVLTHVDAVTVVWAGDPRAADRARFAAWMVNSPYYDPLAEYGVQRGTAHGPFEIKSPPPDVLDDKQVGPLLRARITAGDLPPPAAGILYLLFLPATTQSTQRGEIGCQSYGGYHGWTGSGVTSPRQIAYAIIPDCGGGPDEETVVVSHEIVEAATDPYGDGFYDRGLPLGEVGDLCTPMDIDVTADIPDAGTTTYRVSRYYSQKNADDGTIDPCVPAPPPPYSYFNAALDPALTTLQLDDTGRGTATFQVKPFAFGPVGAISWRIQTWQNVGLTFTPIGATGIPGSTQTVTVKANRISQSGTVPFFIQANARGFTNVWYGAIVVY